MSLTTHPLTNQHLLEDQDIRSWLRQELQHRAAMQHQHLEATRQNILATTARPSSRELERLWCTDYAPLFAENDLWDDAIYRRTTHQKIDKHLRHPAYQRLIEEKTQKIMTSLGRYRLMRNLGITGALLSLGLLIFINSHLLMDPPLFFMVLTSTTLLAFLLYYGAHSAHHRLMQTQERYGITLGHSLARNHQQVFTKHQESIIAQVEECLDEELARARCNHAHMATLIPLIQVLKDTASMKHRSLFNRAMENFQLHILALAVPQSGYPYLLTAQTPSSEGGRS